MKSYEPPKALDTVEEALKRKVKDTRLRKYTYTVPSLWGSGRGKPRAVKVHPYAYYLGVIKKIKSARVVKLASAEGGGWTKDAVIYNIFVRTTTAFDHNGNGALDLPTNSEGLRETGTFLKAMAMLPYIKRLGANTVHLLPITSIGHDGNKGNLGSPYAIRNPYELDENLSEPSLGLDVKVEFRAFVEAAHRLGLHVVVEFVFRTAAKDADWVKEHPEWMYWIKDTVPPRLPGQMDEHTYGSPIFTREELARIHDDVNHSRMGALIPPHKVYRDFFTAPPPADSVKKDGGRYIGTLPDGTHVRIPGAFADWPPDDNQPPWNDVTYLRLYTHPDFNYIGYNTIRMYDTRLTQPEYINRPLWDRIVGIIPYYQREFAIDGVMIDMGHALPMNLKAEMVAKARSANPDFAFWDENFSITKKSLDEGYNAVFGFLWVDQHHPDRMRRLAEQLAREGFPIPFFATPENHNTPRAAARPGGLAYARWALCVNAFLPAIPFIHSGFEIAERFPINTGLDFTVDEIKKLPSETLPLFSAYGYNWLNAEEFTGLIVDLLAIRKQYRSVVVNPDPKTFVMLGEHNGNVLSFARLDAEGQMCIAVISNMDFVHPQAASTRLKTSRKIVTDLLSGKKYHLTDGALKTELAPGGCLILACEEH
ncbi:MAG: alpha amylase catalytic region [Bacteroidetes bacterium]|nr:alpha amylase catalytic region [Bacteroidota bacterium]